MSSGNQSSPLRRLLGFLALLLFLSAPFASLRAVDTLEILTEAPNLQTARTLYNTGEYENAAEYARKAQELDPWVVDWEIFEAKSLLALGRYDEAYNSLESYVAERSFELRPRLLLRDAARLAGRETEAKRQLEAIGYLINERSRRYGYDASNIVAVGEAALLFNIEPKIVLENFFKRAQSRSDAPVSAFSAAGELALEKHDFQLASKSFQQGLESFPDDVDLWFGLARSFSEGDRSKLIEYATKALQINPRHVPTLLLMADHLIAGEAYEEADTVLGDAMRVNPLHPEALAYRAVLAYLKNETEKGAALREQALSTWRSNPQVDYVIGRELAEKYRFQDSASSQRIALRLDPDFNPARIQLAQDLLRLGRNDEAWQQAQAVYQADPYDIAAYNLVTLKDKLDEFETVESDRFLIRLSKEEAPVYGARALELLEDAHDQLTQRYGIELPEKTTVEIYPDPADFETRTFGVPGNPGFLGVCFGPVFTINSPATRSANWEAVLFHEFCHTVTLTLTKNRMPRWLSEGISVYEEQAANPAWGQRMTADYRDRILSNRMQPISEMSAAFLRAQSGEDVQFAYYQSYLVVEFLIQKYGLEPLTALLSSLGAGETINEAIARHYEPLPQLDVDFAAFAKEKASQLASDFRFDQAEGQGPSLLALLRPKRNYSEELQRAKELLSEKNWPSAIEQLEKLVADSGYLPGAENAHSPLAAAYRETGDIACEKATLVEITRHEASRLAPVRRLLEIATEQNDLPEIARWSNAWLAINPMAETPWRALLTASTELQARESAVQAGRSLAALQPPDLPSIHYRLASLLAEDNASEARRHILKALEEAPRFQDAYKLFAQLQAVEPEPPPHDETPQPDENLLDALDLNNDFLR